VKARLGQVVVMGLIIGIIYLGVGGDLSAAGSQSRNGMLFFSVINNVMGSTTSVLSIFAEEKVVFTREYGAGYYGLAPYFLAKLSVDLPANVLFPWVFSTIVSCCGFTLGVAIASSTDSLETSLALAPLILLPLMLFSGLFVNNGSIPVYFDYAFEALMKNEYTGLTIVCSGSSSGVATDGSVCIAQNGMDDALPIGVCAVVLGSIMVALTGLAYLALMRVVAARGRPVAAAAAAPLAAA
ncbi:ATP-binding cassette sub- G member 1, partial [Cladochytrium tenue]